MMDRDLAELYGVETKYLKRQIRRNMKRFPRDFMFQLTKEELSDWRSQFVTSNMDKMGLRYPPFVFSEHKELHCGRYENKVRLDSVDSFEPLNPV